MLIVIGLSTINKLSTEVDTIVVTWHCSKCGIFYINSKIKNNLLVLKIEWFFYIHHIDTHLINIMNRNIKNIKEYVTLIIHLNSLVQKDFKMILI